MKMCWNGEAMSFFTLSGEKQIVSLKLMYITNQPEIALIAEKYGVDRIWIDLEKEGKAERQKGRDSVKSDHTIEDIRTIAPLLSASELLVRINPWNEKSREEIDAVITAGADMIMLPMWKSVNEIALFTEAVNRRCRTTLLLETKEAEECLDEVLNRYCKGMLSFDEIHVGLNDLHISYGLTFMFELLADGTVERICKKIEAVGIPYGFGGIAKIGEGDIPAEKIIMEHYRLHSTRAILSRTFCDSTKIQDKGTIEYVFQENMKKLRMFEKKVQSMEAGVLEKNRDILREDVKKVVEKIKNKGNG